MELVVDQSSRGILLLKIVLPGDYPDVSNAFTQPDSSSRRVLFEVNEAVNKEMKLAGYLRAQEVCIGYRVKWL
jgi:hypothetical protein